MMYRIGLFSKIGKVTIKTLRYYDEIGLLKPAYINPENNYRYYITSQLAQLHQIISLRQVGLSIEDIGLIIAGKNVEAILAKRRTEIAKQLADSQHQLSCIDSYLKGEFKMNYQAVIKPLPECIVFSKHMRLPNYDAYFYEIPKIGRDIQTVNPDLKCTEPFYCFIINHSNDYQEGFIDVEFCEAVEQVGIPVNGIIFKTIRAIPYAVTVMHKGSYSTLHKAYAFALKWVEENGYQVVDNLRESYIDGIWNKADESEWLTEVQIPVKKSAT